MNGTKKDIQHNYLRKQLQNNTTSNNTKINHPSPIFYLDFDKLKNKIRKQSPTVKAKWKSYLSKLIKDIDAYKRTLVSSRNSMVSSSINTTNNTTHTGLNPKKKDYIVEVEDDGDDDRNNITDDDEGYETENDVESHSFRSQINGQFDDDDNSDDGNDILEEILKKHRGKKLHTFQGRHRTSKSDLQRILSSFRKFLSSQNHHHHVRKYNSFVNDADDDSDMLVDASNYGDDENAQIDSRDTGTNVFSEPFDLEQGFISGNRRRLGQKLFGLSPSPTSYVVSDNNNSVQDNVNRPVLNGKQFELTRYNSAENAFYQTSEVAEVEQDSVERNVVAPIVEKVLWRDPNTNQLFVLQEDST